MTDLQTFVIAKRTEAAIPVEGTPFAFLSTADWLSDASSSQNYATLVAQQDELFELGLKKIQNMMDVSDGSTDTQIIQAITTKGDTIPSAIGTLKNILDIICLGEFGNKTVGAPGNESSFICNAATKFWSLIYTTVKSDNNLQPKQLANILLRPITVQNIAVSSVAKIIHRFKSDSDTRALLTTTGNASIVDLSRYFLIDKYATHMQTVAYHLTNDSLKDFLYLWGCPRSGYEAWRTFYETFLTIALDGTIQDFNESDLQAVSHLGRLDPKTELTIITNNLNRLAKITAIFYKHCDKSKEEIFSKFVGVTSIKPAPTPTPTAGTAGGAAAGPTRRSGKQTPPSTDFIGMLPTTEWDKPIATFTPAGANPIEITFGKLLRKLSVEEVHYILHLTHVYKKLTEAPAPTAGSSGGAASGSGTTQTPTDGSADSGITQTPTAGSADSGTTQTPTAAAVVTP